MLTLFFDKSLYKKRTNKNYIMERKLKYMAPAILEELKIEMEGEILAASHLDEPIEDYTVVETEGQEINSDLSWEQKW